MSNKPSAIIFDLDGTLVDSARDLSAALNHVLKQAHRPEIHLSKVRHMVGDGARAMILKGFAETGPLPGEKELNNITQDFLDYYSENITDKTTIFPGVMTVIQELAQMNIPMGLCTNKAIKLTNKLIAQIGLADFFTAVVGGDSFEYRKPDPRHLTATLDMMKCPLNRAVMVGDSDKDILAAKAAGMPVICVSFGYSKTPVSEFNPDIILDHYDDFFKALTEVSKDF
ncbi:MAG: phosphoglycolate phosphatase [Emcibacter sp.]|nr:phosphoglycolate phosphatase [Emcibacter sp.]